MYYQVKPYPWACLATSFSMVLDIPIQRFIDLAGHDGGEVIFPWLAPPACYRGFHVSEAARVALELGYSATPIQLFPQMAPAELPVEPDGMFPTPTTCDTQIYYPPHFDGQSNLELFERLIHTTEGVIECRTSQSHWHAVAYCQGWLFDPDDGNSFFYTQDACESRNLYTVRLWVVQKVNQ